VEGSCGGRRRVGKPRNRWIDAVEEDAKKLMGVRNWKRTAQDRDKGGQGPTSGCCAIEEEEEEEEGSCEHGNEPSASIKCWRLLKMDSASCNLVSYLVSSGKSTGLLNSF
jgi:hypothetical protein